MKIVADDKIPFLRGVFESAGCNVLYLPGKDIDRASVADADAVITRTRTVCNASLLEGSSVKAAATATIGTDHFNIPELEEMGIAWSNAPGCNSSSVAQYLTAALTCCGNYKGKTIGVIGAGNVGRKVVKAAGALGMNVLINDPPRAEQEGDAGFTGIEELAEKSDFITCHVPLERSGKYPTYHLCGEDFFRHVKRGAVFINTSRGEAVDTAALKSAKISGIISKTVVDVWENEPDIDPDLLRLADISTSHIAGYSLDGKANGTVASVRFVADKLGIDKLKLWSCFDAVPVPEESRIFIPDDFNCTDAVRYAVKCSYDIMRDSCDLKREPEKFESLRGNYYLRREFPAFTVENAPDEAGNILKKLGFTVI